MPEQNASSITDAVQACTIYLSSLVSIVHDCYQKFKTIVDPKWYFTEENFAAMNRTFEDAVVELGFPKIWAACAPSGTAAWEVLRSQQPACQINDIFKKYLGKTILSPDELLF